MIVTILKILKEILSTNNDFVFPDVFEEQEELWFTYKNETFIIKVTKI